LWEFFIIFVLQRPVQMYNYLIVYNTFKCQTELDKSLCNLKSSGCAYSQYCWQFSTLLKFWQRYWI